VYCRYWRDGWRGLAGVHYMVARTGTSACMCTRYDGPPCALEAFTIEKAASALLAPLVIGRRLALALAMAVAVKGGNENEEEREEAASEPNDEPGTC
jgi:hypothetical protein